MAQFRLRRLLMVGVAIGLFLALHSEELQRAAVNNRVMLGLSVYLLGQPRSPTPSPMRLIEVAQLGDERVRCFVMGHIAVEEKLLIEAARWFRCAVEEVPDNVVLRFFLGQTLLGAGEVDAAVNEFRQIGDASYFVRRGLNRILSQDNRFGLELDFSQKAIYYDLGDVLWRQRQKTDEAVEAFRLATRYAPEPGAARYWFAKGFIAEAEGDWEQAIRYYTQVVSLNPYDTDAYVHLIEMLAVRLGDYPAARQWAALLVDRVPEYQSGWLYEGALYTLEGKYAQAEEWLTAMRDQHPDWPDVYFSLGYNASQSGDEELARSYYAEGIRRFPPNKVLRLYWELGKSYAREEKWAQAIPPLEMAVQMRPQSAYYHLELAGAYLFAGRPVDAKTQYDIVLALDPENGPARAGLAALETDR